MVSQNLTELAASDPQAHVRLRVGDELRFVEHTESWWAEWWAPDSIEWTGELVQRVQDQLARVGVHTELIAAPKLLEEWQGIGVTFTLAELRLRIRGFSLPPGFDSAAAGDELYLPGPEFGPGGEYGLPELEVPIGGVAQPPEVPVYEAGVNPWVAAIILASVLLVVTIVDWAIVELVAGSGPLSSAVEDAGVAFKIGALAALGFVAYLLVRGGRSP